METSHWKLYRKTKSLNSADGNILLRSVTSLKPSHMYIRCKYCFWRKNLVPELSLQIVSQPEQEASPLNPANPDLPRGFPPLPRDPCFCPLTHTIANPGLSVGRRQTGWGSSSHLKTHFAELARPKGLRGSGVRGQGTRGHASIHMVQSLKLFSPRNLRRGRRG